MQLLQASTGSFVVANPVACVAAYDANSQPGAFSEGVLGPC